MFFVYFLLDLLSVFAVVVRLELNVHMAALIVRLPIFEDLLMDFV